MKNPWSVIEKPSVDYNVRLIDKEHSLRLFWGIDAQSRYLFAYEATIKELPQKKALPGLAGVDVHIATQGDRGKLVLIVQDNSNWEIFYALCSDLVRATETVKDESIASSIIIRRLQRWQELLRKKRPDILTPEQIKGLIGELLFLKYPLAKVFGYDTAIAAWRGPEGAPQDFSINETAVEVKCQSGGTRSVIRINSADQLSPQLPFGYLVVYTLANQTPDKQGSLNLNSLISEIRNDIIIASAAGHERFEDLLYMAGYLPSEIYEEHCFSVVSVKCYQLIEGFPRIVNSSLISGVESVSYDIRLDACTSFQTKPEWWDLL